MEILNFIKKNYKSIFIAIFFIIILLFLNQCNSTKKWKNNYNKQVQKNVQNLEALTDTFNVYKDKNNEKSYSKAIAQMDKEELKKHFPELYKQIEAESSEIIYITNTKIVYVDSGKVANVVAKLGENHYGLKSEYYNKDSTLYLKSVSKFYAKVKFIDKDKTKFDLKIIPDFTKYEKMEFKLGLSTGIKKDDDGVFRIFVKPDNDKFVVTDLKGADVSNFLGQQEDGLKTRKRWSVGPYLGYGVVFGTSNQMYHGISVGASIQYALLRF